MIERSLLEGLDATMARLTQLAEDHRRAQEYDLSCERMAYVAAQLITLQGELSALRRSADLLASLGAADEAEVWRKTCVQLRTGSPRALQSPGRALVTGDVELLRLVAYAAGGTLIARERRILLARELARRIDTLEAAQSCRHAAGDGREIDLQPLRQALELLSTAGTLTLAQLMQLETLVVG